MTAVTKTSLSVLPVEVAAVRNFPLGNSITSKVRRKLLDVMTGDIGRPAGARRRATDAPVDAS